MDLENREEENHKDSCASSKSYQSKYFLKKLLRRLKRPSTLLSLVSQVAALLLLIGFKIDQNAIMGIATAACSILITLGILSNYEK